MTSMIRPSDIVRSQILSLGSIESFGNKVNIEKRGVLDSAILTRDRDILTGDDVDGR